MRALVVLLALVALLGPASGTAGSADATDGRPAVPITPAEPKVGPKGTMMTLACPADVSGSCQGQLTLKTIAPLPALLGTLNYRVVAGQACRLLLPMRSIWYRTIREVKRFRVRARNEASSDSGRDATTTKVVTLKPLKGAQPAKACTASP